MSIQSEIQAAFLVELSKKPDFTPEMLDELTKLLTSGKKVKPEEVAAIFAEAKEKKPA